MPPLNAAIFDFTGVITTSPLTGIFDYESELGLERGRLLRIFMGGPDDGDDPWHRLERGEAKITEVMPEILSRIHSELGTEISLQDLTKHFIKGFTVRGSVIELVEEAKGRVPMALLTNNVKEFSGYWRSMAPVEDLFDVIIDSSEVGLRKPDPRIFELALSKIGASASETVFVDDSSENVAAAESLGMTGVHFSLDADEDEVVGRIRSLLDL